MGASFNFPFLPMPVTVGITREEQGSGAVCRSFPEGGTHSNTGPPCKVLQLQRLPLRWEEVLMARRGKEVPASDQLLQKPFLGPVSLFLIDDFDLATA